ncbi:hypothetical protein [Citrobacter sedlakii]|uniref:hypothetical protein n=1 Tax=Citrobacter sedlakii TaxID=67826 RepID=UPI00388E5784
MNANGVNDGATFARFQGALRQNGAAISGKFRRRSHFQNYIWYVHNIADFHPIIHLSSKHIHFLCSKSEYRQAITH